MEEIIRLENVAKIYGNTKALNNVNVEFRAGEIHGLVGENGAGKSTMAKILSGDIEVTKGNYLFDGELFTEPTPRKAAARGISIIHQYGDLALNLTILENLFLGYEMKKPSGFLDFRKMEEKAFSVFSRFNIDVDLHQVTGELPPVMQQLTVIGKALCKDARILIVDEGGVSLDREDLEYLFSVLRKLKEEGVCIIYISHLLDNVMNLSDRITVLRNGNHITTVDAADVGMRELVDYIVGHEVVKKSNINTHFTDESKNAVLEYREVTWLENGLPYSFSLHKGEILGFTGPAGAGKSETFRMLMGLLPKAKGEILIKGKVENSFSPLKMTGNGIAYVPEDRFAEGMIPGWTIEKNISLPNLRKKSGWINSGLLKDIAEKISKTLKVKMSGVGDRMTELSGGNQQKVVIGKWLDEDYDIFVFDEPYKGIDIGAKEDINDVIKDLAERGKSIVVISTEFSDLIGLVHNLNIMVNRKIIKCLPADEVENKRIMEYYQSSDKQEAGI